tara:strand:- start:214 stop:975 length:762 start_codon:yes stop_codon:yes gene_type:complete
MYAFKKFIKDKINVIKYRGSNYECPICSFGVKQFLPFGRDLEVIKEKEIIGAGRRNSRCPKCSSIDRERLIYLYLNEIFKNIDNISDLKLLHIAPEKRLMGYLSGINIKEYVCGDLFAEGYNYPSLVQRIDVTNIPFEKNYFDIIICNHVLEHVEEDTKAMKEIFRVLGKNGKAILQVPISFKIEKTFEDFKVTSPKEREITFGQHDHVRIYGKDYVNRLESCGFSVEISKFSADHEYYGTDTLEPIFVAMKS